MDIIAQLRDRLLERVWSVANDSPLAVLCVVPLVNSPGVAGIVPRTLDSGRAWVVRVRLEGREVIRNCATHGETALADVEELVGALIG